MVKFYLFLASSKPSWSVFHSIFSPQPTKFDTDCKTENFKLLSMFKFKMIFSTNKQRHTSIKWLFWFTKNKQG